MKTLEITTNVGCSNRCIYCPQDLLVKAYWRRSNIFQMSFETFKTCIDKVPQDIDFHFTGMGEPFLNPLCSDMLAYASKTHRTGIGTTMTGMTMEDVEKIKDLSFKYFAIHFPSTGEFEKIKVDKNYMELLSKLIKTKIKINGYYHGDKINPEVGRMLKKPMGRRGLHNRAGNIDIGRTYGRSKGEIKCIRGLQRGVLLPNGDVALCCMDFGLTEILGNLLHSDYASLSVVDVERRMKDDSYDVICRYCLCTSKNYEEMITKLV